MKCQVCHRKLLMYEYPKEYKWMALAKWRENMETLCKEHFEEMERWRWHESMRDWDNSRRNMTRWERFVEWLQK